MKMIALLVFVIFSISSQAQSDIVSELKEKKVGQGTVMIYQDVRLNTLLKENRVVTPGVVNDEQRVVKIAGFRIQVYAGNNSRQARNEATMKAEQVRKVFPELQIYTHFINPRWLCQVGDFRSIEEADAVMRRLKAAGDFKEVSIVRAQINIPY